MYTLTNVIYLVNNDILAYKLMLYLINLLYFITNIESLFQNLYDFIKYQVIYSITHHFLFAGTSGEKTRNDSKEEYLKF